jgi:hypothetical protein
LLLQILQCLEVFLECIVVSVIFAPLNEYDSVDLWIIGLALNEIDLELSILKSISRLLTVYGDLSTLDSDVYKFVVGDSPGEKLGKDVEVSHSYLRAHFNVENLLAWLLEIDL